MIRDEGNGKPDPTDLPAARIFISYTHVDDDAFAGAVTALATDIGEHYHAETGRELAVFFDRVSIGWGSDLRTEIGTSVEDATFLIPIVTARYFKSQWCRDEFLAFYSKSKSLGVTELILPIVLAGAPLLQEDSDDEVVRIMSRIVYLDWTSTWQHGRGSPEWNLKTTELVQTLAELSRSVESALALELAREASQQGTRTDASEVEAPTVVADPANETAEILLDSISALVSRYRMLLEEIGRRVEQLGDTATYSGRLAMELVGQELNASAHSLERQLRLLLEEVVDFDIALRSRIRRQQISGPFAESRRLAPTIEAIRQGGLTLGHDIRNADSESELLADLARGSVGFRIALAPARAALQTIRDIAQVVESWVSVEP